MPPSSKLNCFISCTFLTERRGLRVTSFLLSSLNCSTLLEKSLISMKSSGLDSSLFIFPFMATDYLNLSRQPAANVFIKQCNKQGKSGQVNSRGKYWRAIPVRVYNCNQLISTTAMQVVGWISKQAGKISDKFEQHKFYVKSTPDRIDSSTKLFLNVFSSREEEAMVPCVYRWYRIKNGITSEVQEFKGNTFLCQPSDVGCVLQAEVTSIDEQYPGTALLKYGPVEIDVLLKSSIEGALSTGQAKFQVDIGHEDNIRQCTFQITDDNMRLAHCNSSAHFKFYYCLGQPLINSLSKDPTNIIMIFPQKYEAETIKFLSELWNDFALTNQEKTKNELVVTLRFVNRRAKDEFLFIMKGFIAKRQLKTSSIIKKIEKLDVDSTNINYLMEIESLRKDLLKLNNINKKTYEEKKIYMEETIKLEREIQDIISSYTKLIEGKFKTREEFEESFIDFENKKDHATSHKYRKLEEENAKLKEYIREKVDGEHKDTYVDQLQETEGRMDYLKPFTKKKEPFTEMESKKVAEYENILQNMSADEDLLMDEKNNLSQLVVDKERLEHRFNRSLIKIQKLEGELDKVNRSAVYGEDNLSFSRNNISALDISTNKVIEEKSVLDKKYIKLKGDYIKLKAAYDGLKKNNVQVDNTNPEFKESSDKENLRLRSALAAMEREKEAWKEQAEQLASELRKERQEYESDKFQLQKKIRDLSQQIEVSRKSTDVMNRSQHLSMQMDDYNYQQTEILKEQNTFLVNQNERLTKMCEKYKNQYKKIKESYRNGTESMLV